MISMRDAMSNLNKISISDFAENLDRFRVPLASNEREKRKGNIPYYGAAKVIDYVNDFTHQGLSVLIAEDGSVENEKGFPIVQLANGKYWVNNHTHVLKGKDDYETKYLYYALQIIKVAPFITGAVQKKISQKALNSIEISYFENKDIRHQIVDILSSLDEKIELNTQTNQTLENIAQAIFKSWFIDFDPVRAKATALADGLTAAQAERAAMSVISGKNPAELDRLQTENPDQYQQLQQLAQAFPSEFEEVEGFGEVPRGWGAINVDTLFDFIGGSQPPKSEHIYELKEGYERFIQNRDYANDNHKTYIPISKRNKLCNAKDILICKYGVGTGNIYFGLNGAYNVALAKIQPIFNNMREFLRQYFSQHKIKEYLASSSMASTRNSLNSTTFTGMEVILPSEDILICFENMISFYIDKHLEVKKENNALIELRDYLLPKLLNGNF